jgi:polysaccharide export outer membrane protein
VKTTLCDLKISTGAFEGRSPAARSQRRPWLAHAWACAALLCCSITFAALAEDSGASSYVVQPGDVLRISVWREPDLNQDLLVAPDGAISFPLCGQIAAAGKTVAGVELEIVTRIETYIPEAVVTVQVLQTDGNAIYVLGKVNRPGSYVMSRPLDVTQALALAGGLAVFAQDKDIAILRRDGGQQTAC